MKQIENVLSKLDADKDGAISVEEVLKVSELIKNKNVNRLLAQTGQEYFCNTPG